MPKQLLEFEWDPKKAASNMRKHGVSFEEAASAFDDILATVYEDPLSTGKAIPHCWHI